MVGVGRANRDVKHNEAADAATSITRFCDPAILRAVDSKPESAARGVSCRVRRVAMSLGSASCGDSVGRFDRASGE
ncbi:MAG TPA: hypothetical protein DCQ98_06360 [Planctomycetaceae bacterium]|nr:hypothetical protein [Planctomycetaceae bacterium]